MKAHSLAAFACALLVSCGPTPAPAPTPIHYTFRAAQICDLPGMDPKRSEELTGKTVVVRSLSPLILPDGWAVVVWQDHHRPPLVVVLPENYKAPKQGEPFLFEGTYRGLRTEPLPGCPVTPPFVLVD